MKKLKTVSRFYSKKDVQAQLKSMRKIGLKPEKSYSGYTVWANNNKENIVLFRAMHGRNGYLVTHVDNLFV